jgi:glycosyltransferase involved in cell wall biosynthesis
MNAASLPIDESLLVPEVAPVRPVINRPLWSVMIPTYNCDNYLRQTLVSVLSQGVPADEMQIEVIDDCSTVGNPKAVVDELGKGRVSFYTQSHNVGATKNFNTCVQRSTGHLVHVLHGDDTVLNGYYSRIAELAVRFPEVALFATRCFLIDENSIITGVTERFRTHEHPTKSVSPFFKGQGIQFAGTTARRSAYEALGGFRLDLIHAADLEMWTRIISAYGGIILSDVLACYRVFATNDTGRLVKTGDNVRDICRLNTIFSKRYAEFPSEMARADASWMAWHQYSRFQAAGDEISAAANYQLWCDLTPLRARILLQARIAKQKYKKYIRRLFALEK